MLKKLYILIALTVLPMFGYAQSTAVMEVKVRVISGVQVQQPTSINLFENNLDDDSQAIVIKTSPNSDVTISTSDHLILKNELGNKIDILTESVQKSNSVKGIHRLSISSLVENEQELKGNYKGSFKTVINYL